MAQGLGPLVFPRPNMQLCPVLYSLEQQLSWHAAVALFYHTSRSVIDLAWPGQSS
jgi:hypothetical protein